MSKRRDRREAWTEQEEYHAPRGSGVKQLIILLAVALITTGEEFLGVAKLAVVAHIPIVIVEGIIVGFCVAFLARVKPEILEGHG